MCLPRVKDLRLTPKGRELGLVDDTRWQHFESKQTSVASESERLKNILVHPATEEAAHIEKFLQQPLSKEYRLLELLRRPELNYADLMSVAAFGPGLSDHTAAAQIEIQVKYAGYIERQEDEIARQLKQETTKIPASMDYSNISGLSTELRQKLALTQPATVGMAARIPGMTPAAISLLLVHLKRRCA